MEVKKLVVSNEFVEVFRNFNVSNQIEEINKLSDKEKYLLLLCCLDQHNDSIPTVKFNFQPFKSEVMELFDLQDDKVPTNQILIDLMSETGDQYIDTSVIVTMKGNQLPQPYNQSEIRNKKISLLDSDDSI